MRRSSTSIAADCTLRPASQREIVLSPRRSRRASSAWVRPFLMAPGESATVPGCHPSGGGAEEIARAGQPLVNGASEPDPASVPATGTRCRRTPLVQLDHVAGGRVQQFGGRLSAGPWGTAIVGRGTRSSSPPPPWSAGWRWQSHGSERRPDSARGRGRVGPAHRHPTVLAWPHRFESSTICSVDRPYVSPAHSLR